MMSTSEPAKIAETLAAAACALGVPRSDATAAGLALNASAATAASVNAPRPPLDRVTRPLDVISLTASPFDCWLVSSRAPLDHHGGRLDGCCGLDAGG